MNYGAFKSWLKGYLNRDDLDSYLDGFVNAAITLLEKQYNFNYMLKETSGNVVRSAITQPTDFKAVSRLLIYEADDENDYYTTYPVDSQYYYDKLIAGPDVQPNDTTYKDFIYFFVDKSDIKLYPQFEDGKLKYKLRYYAFSKALENDGDSHFLIDRATPLLLYGSLLQAEPFLMNDSRLEVWRAFYNEALLGLIRADVDKEFPYPLVIRRGVDV